MKQNNEEKNRRNQQNINSFSDEGLDLLNKTKKN